MTSPASDTLARLRQALNDRYAVERELGRGGMATVFLAEDRRHGRRVALKVLHPELASTLSADRFLFEIEATASLEHPNILPLLDSGEADGLLYYVLPYVDGGSLRERLEREAQLPIDDAVRIVLAIADALSCAHANGIVHRDVKPENILLSNGHARLADFGIAKALSPTGESPRTATGLAIGSQLYMSPEQHAGEKVDARSDVYSLAIVFYELLAGQPPFTGASYSAIMARKAVDAVPSLRIVRGQVPPDVEDVIITALAPVAADRYPDASQFRNALALAWERRPARSSTGATRPRAWMTRAQLSVAVVALVGTSAGLAFWGGTQPTPPSSVAVLPFANISGDTTRDYFVSGLQDDVRRALSLSVGTMIPVLASSATQSLPTGEAPGETARRLGVDAMVMGEVRRVGTGVEVTVSLFRAASNKVSWRETFAGALETSGTLQPKIVERLIPALGLRAAALGAAIPLNRAASPTRVPEAYDAYLRGRHYMSRLPTRTVDAIREFERAVELDGEFAEAHASLAEAYSWGGGEHESQFRERAWTSAFRALELDARLPEAHVAVAWLRMRSWDWAGAEEGYRRALVLDPNSARAHQYYADLLRVSRRFEEAAREVELARPLDPTNMLIRAMAGWVLYDRHRFDEALAVFKDLLILDPGYGTAIYNEALVYWMKGMGAETVDAGSRAGTAAYPIPADMSNWLQAAGHALLGRRERALALAASLPLTATAAIHLTLGDQDRALDLLEDALRNRHFTLPYITSEPIFDPLRTHPRFIAVRQGMGLP